MNNLVSLLSIGASPPRIRPAQQGKHKSASPRRRRRPSGTTNPIVFSGHEATKVPTISPTVIRDQLTAQPEQPKPVPKAKPVLGDLVSLLAASVSNSEAFVSASLSLGSLVKSFKRPEDRYACQMALVKARVLEPLMRGASAFSPLNDTARAAGLRVMASICFGNRTTRDVVSERGAVDLCKGYLHPERPHKDGTLRRNALALLNTMAGSLATHERIMRDDGGALLVARIGHTEQDNVAQQAIACLRNLAFNEKNRADLVKAGALQALNGAITHWNLAPDSYAATDITLATACLVGHQESSPFLNIDAALVANIISHFDRTLQSKETYVIWKMCFSVAMLAVNEVTKVMLGDRGVVNLLERALQHSPVAWEDDDKELRETYALTALWNLSFHPPNAIRIKQQSKVVEILHSLRWSMNSRIRKAASGALLTLGLHFASDEVGVPRPPSRESSATAAAGHVMISYCWQQQEIALRIKDALTAGGFQVWMDVDKLSGNTLESMSKGVEGAMAVIMAVSVDYKESANCRLEAEYANQTQRPLLPIIVGEGYAPDGWLGLLVGAKVYVNFTLGEPFSTCVDKLKREINALLQLSTPQSQRLNQPVGATKAQSSSEPSQARNQTDGPSEREQHFAEQLQEFKKRMAAMEARMATQTKQNKQMRQSVRSLVDTLDQTTRSLQVSEAARASLEETVAQLRQHTDDGLLQAQQRADQQAQHQRQSLVQTLSAWQSTNESLFKRMVKSLEAPPPK